MTFGSNVYDDSKSGFPFVTANIWAISKPAASDSTCSSGVSATYFADATHLLKNSDGTLAFTPVPANTADAAAMFISPRPIDCSPVEGDDLAPDIFYGQLTPSPTSIEMWRRSPFWTQRPH